MSLVEVFVRSYQFNRQRTLELLSRIEEEPDPTAVLGWRPGVGRAHIAWQLMHIAVTEEVFATRHLDPSRRPRWQELWEHFGRGSTPGEQIPPPEQIRRVLEEARQELLEALAGYGDDRLEEVPPTLAARGWSVRDVLDVLGWHEAHHQGQAHLTYNLYRAQKTQ